MFPIIYLTCELKSRDLPSRALIASHLLAAGYTVVLGQQWSIFSHLRLSIPRGAVLFKSANKLQAERMAWGRGAGHLIFAADEECLPSAPHAYANSTDPSVGKACDCYLALNHLHASALAGAYPDLAEKIEVCGSARTDLLREVRHRRTERPLPEEYVLFNTSFAVTRSTWGGVEAAIDVWNKGETTPPGPLRDKLMKDRLDFEAAALTETRAVIDWLLEHDRRRVVIRPHPQEDGAHWARQYGEKVTLAPGSDMVQWMRHAGLVIHSESTTGIEAAMLGVPVLNLSPPLPWRDRLIVSEVNPTVPGAREAVAAIASGRLPASRQPMDTLFPAGGARRTAELIARALPPPAPVPAFHWHQGPRPEAHKAKFTVSLDEMKALVPGNVRQLDDSIFLLRPSAQ